MCLCKLLYSVEVFHNNHFRFCRCSLSVCSLFFFFCFWLVISLECSVAFVVHVGLLGQQLAIVREREKSSTHIYKCLSITNTKKSIRNQHKKLLFSFFFSGVCVRTAKHKITTFFSACPLFFSLCSTKALCAKRFSCARISVSFYARRLKLVVTHV